MVRWVPLIPGIENRSLVLLFNNLSIFSVKSLFPKFTHSWILYNAKWNSESSQVPFYFSKLISNYSLLFIPYFSLKYLDIKKVKEKDRIVQFLLTTLLNSHHIKFEFTHKTLRMLEFNQDPYF